MSENKYKEFERNLAAYYASQFKELFSATNHLAKEYPDEEYQEYVKAVAKLIADDRIEIHLELPVTLDNEVYMSPEIRHLIYMEKAIIDVADHGKEFNANKAKPSPYGIKGECHAMAAFHWVMEQNCTICTGISDKIHAHSWLLSHDGFVIEPTPIPRENYYGIAVDKPIAFVREEFDRIMSMFDDPYYQLIHPFKKQFLDEYYSL